VKILDKYLLKSFLITFTTVFVILFFIFILQTVWLFISELAGKDLDFFMVMKFLLFAMPRIVPLVLPLSVLLASIMTFGSFAENYEFAAMKSAGISLQRAMKPLVILILFFSIIAFWFANNIIPYAEYKFINFRRNIAQVKPAMAIAEGQFSEIGNYTIKVAKKSGENGNLLSDINIHIKSNTGEGNKTVIQAKKGELVSSEKSNTLKLLLFDGTYYEDIYPKKYEERNRMPHAKATFKRDIINIDLSKLNKNEDTGEITNTNNMLNISELNYTLDSLNTNYKKDIKSYSENLYQRINSTPYSPNVVNPTNKTFDFIGFLNNQPFDKKLQVYNVAKNNVEGTVFSIDSSKFEMDEKKKNINVHWIALYDKFVLAFSCILMFFIGAPLGAIIRKGGLGLPIVFAVGIFIVFHFINTFGKKVAQEDGISPFLGTWMSTMVLSPLAIFFTYKATNDIGGTINFDFITEPISKLFQKIKEKKNNKSENLKSINAQNIDEELNENDKNIVNQIINEPKIIDTVALIPLYSKQSKVALISYFVVLINALLSIITFNKITYILFGLFLLLFLFLLHKAKKSFSKLAPNYEPGWLITLVIAFPFYPFLYFYFKNQLSKINIQNNNHV
jgi:lipopolysaccharide export system permease protein